MSDSDEDSRFSNYQSQTYLNSTQNQNFPKYATGYANDSEDEDDDFENDYGYRNNGNEELENGYHRMENDNGRFGRNPAPPPKRIKLKNVAEFGGIGEWGDHETFVLLDVWGERFVLLGRRSLRSEDWDDVAEKVSQVTGVDRTETQCRSRLDVLKKRYKKEKERMGSSKWVFFKKMDRLMGMSRGGGGGGLACGVDSGEYVFMDSDVYLDRSNGFDEMRDSPGASEMSEEEEEDGNDEGNVEVGNGSSVRMLADSVMKFGELYKKIEDSRRSQMIELEKMRINCQREMEMEKRQIIQRAQAEIAQIREMDDDEDSSDSSVDNHSE